MKKLLCFYLLFCAALVHAQAPAPYGPLPSKAQLQWHETGMYCIVHYGPDTYTNKEWGYGDEDPAIVNPDAFDAMQVVAAAKAGGFKGIVLVAKHHDGFCLWPTSTTEHNISKSPWKNGKGDMVREYAEACKKLGIKMGIYCSPWDRNNADYGTTAYLKVYRGQIRELYSHYGPLFMSWHDGANGGEGYYGGARERRNIDRSTYYGWDTTWALVRQLQPMAAIYGDVGPDVRWVGNEKGEAGETCWSTYTPHAPEAGKAPANGFTLDKEGTQGQRDGQYWMPAECDVPLRPGWMYHPEEDNRVKTPATLLDIYFKSVGRGAGLDLGLSPNRHGQLHPNDVAALAAFGKILRQTFTVNLLKNATIHASNIRQHNALFGTARLTDADPYSYWATDDSLHTATLEADMGQPQIFDVIRLKENIQLGQRVEAFAVDAWENGQWQEIAAGTSIGAQRLLRLSHPVTAAKVRFRFTKAPVCLAISDAGLFKIPDVR
ncbi:alpha-L-fucosidase [Chitinophaga costaii]|uniref:alpha-L-fucosidase n=1 Tax=Chitinophaga costaii TaxID=1335309 RepID=A0A1C4BIA3_9BACT|nr:alpha-L-fucosidase [Chitinophaga costaii]PUZ27595.1 alpha-L-fucosidase [Chitinophaga costaii]SCC06619.1 alpha-L-fucosidase [Chitinophaga costaii]